MAEKHQDHWSRATPATNYERFFVPAIGRPLAEDLIRQARLTRGERVLDVGCGTGVVTRLAAERVGEDGRVVGLDVNPGMLAVAKSVTASELGIEWREASADAIPLPDESFDVVLCQLSLQFMPDRTGALREMRRVLVPGGRLVLNVPGPADPLFETLIDGMDRHISPEAAGFVQAVFSLNDESEIEDLLTGAGFREVAAHAETPELSLPPAREFLWQYVTSTPLAGVIAEAPEEARAALEADVAGAWAEHEEDDRLPYRQRIVVASARR